ncbi:hypothetical protein AN619_03830 [Thermotalea metallivorans]|uniref:Uncharacterized protein n=1 Tax=Thermotalea metallivorans TaxID=520762 RepID=A0A140LB56_9FIRM|nr:hypothetical protein AN619_03830 [Thermotalea metallivorans]
MTVLLNKAEKIASGSVGAYKSMDGIHPWTYVVFGQWM